MSYELIKNINSALPKEFEDFKKITDVNNFNFFNNCTFNNTVTKNLKVENVSIYINNKGGEHID